MTTTLTTYGSTFTSYYSILTTYNSTLTTDYNAYVFPLLQINPNNII